MKWLLRGWPCLIVLLGIAGPVAAVRADYNFIPLQGPGSTDTEPYGINNNGTVTGLYNDASGNYHGFLYQIQTNTFTSVDTPVVGATATFLYAGNDYGQIAGGYQDSNGIYHATIYNSANNSWTNLPDPNGQSMFNAAGAITNSGQVFGNWADNVQNVNLHAWVYQLGVGYTAFFDAPGADPTQEGTVTYGANSAGVNVGYYYLSNGSSTAFTYASATGTLTPYNAPNALSTAFYGINDSGVIDGNYIGQDNQSHGLILSNNVATTLDFPGAANTILTGIDNRGDLIGYYYDNSANPTYYGFIATVAEPSSLALASVGGVALVVCARRRRKLLPE